MIRATIVLLGIVLYVLLVGPITLLITRVFHTHHFLYNVARVGTRWALFLTGSKMKIRGREKIRLDRNYIYMPNHQGNADPVAAFISIPHDVKAIAKKEFFKTPILSAACRLERFIPVDRKNHESAVRSVEQSIRQLLAGDSFLIYPEGTRTKTGVMGGFRKGGFIAAIRANVPIVPVTIDGCYDIMKKGEFKIRPGRITVTFHEPIEVSDYTLEDRDRLLEEVRAAIISGLEFPHRMEAEQDVARPDPVSRS